MLAGHYFNRYSVLNACKYVLCVHDLVKYSASRIERATWLLLIYIWCPWLVQALELIRELQKKYPITRACMKLRFVVPDNQIDRLTTTLNTWNARIETKEKMTAVTTLVFP
jgi:hypothetical protein